MRSESLSQPRWLGAPVTDAELRADGNAFTLMRWILASTVMFSHGWDLTQPSQGLDPSVAILGQPVSRLAVLLFFSLSGYLVIGGLLRRGVGTFLKNRALRLIPGLWVMLIVVPVLLWLVCGTTPAADFFTHRETLAYVWRNALLIGGAYTLPGIFLDSPSMAVNGSLWTIPYEVRCYLALALLAGLGLGLTRRRLTIILLAGLALHLALPENLIPPLMLARRLGFAFFVGVLAWLWRERMSLSWPLAVAGVAAALLVPVENRYQLPAIEIALTYFVMVAAFRMPAAIKTASQRLPDYSYGIYIYAFPAQQVALHFGAADPLANIAWGFLITLPLAALSWHLIEEPALSLKRVR
ncbi:acyltransferase family protein [Polymorphobacter fuscus]|nr:acyltransferase [Polymorphobacter fuscus]NJC07200.1 peptidoglycan/LPS O-acetylase OafA/YrhL [Polymorphobacter fuscus]